jgi:type I restriction enzyme, S subunit
MNAPNPPLPAGWSSVTMADVGEYINGRGFKKSEWAEAGVPIIRIQDLTGSRNKPHFFKGNADPQHRVVEGDLLVSWAATLGVYWWRGPEAVLNQHIFKVKSRIHSRFHYYALRAAIGDLYRLSHGSGMVHITKGRFERTQLLLPPFAEQERIVAAIESYFSRLDDGVAGLERVERNLKRYRSSVLKAAVEGRLVPTEAELALAEGRDYEPAGELLKSILAERRQQWEKSGRRGNYNEPIAPDVSDLPELPEGWCWTTADQLTSGDRNSAYGVLVPGPDLIDGVPLVRVGDIESGSVRTDNLKRISRTIADKFAKTYLKGGEVLLTLVGTIGRTAVVPQALAGANVARAVGVVPVSRLISPNWVEIWFRSPAQRYSLEQKAHEVARKTLNLEDVRAAVVGLPPLQEQLRVCEAVEDLNSLAAAAAESVRADLLRCTRLRQSILRWAFEGKLADQDPSDVPVSRLLEGIRAEGRSGDGRRRKRCEART